MHKSHISIFTLLENINRRAGFVQVYKIDHAVEKFPNIFLFPIPEEGTNQKFSLIFLVRWGMVGEKNPNGN